MCGCWWASSASRVGRGTPEPVTNRTGSPLSAAQPAAGIANAGFSPDAITTSGLLLPTAAVLNRSIAAARAYGSPPEIVAVRWPEILGTSPTRITCAPPIAPEPEGASACSASVVADGSVLEPDSRIGALIGGDINTAEAIDACQLSSGASVTTCGWVPGPLEGYTASATPAASTVGSPPETRVVFLVASAGNPILCPAFGVEDGMPCSGTVISWVDPPHPARAHAAPTSTSSVTRRIAALTLQGERRGGRRSCGPCMCGCVLRRQFFVYFRDA